MNIKKALSGLSKAKVTKKGTYLTEGRYVLKVKATPMIEPMNGPPAFILEAEVVESSNTEHPAGSERTWFQSLKFQESAFGELKKFTYAILKLEPSNPEHKAKIAKLDDEIEPFLESVIEQNKFVDKLVRCEVVERDTKKLGPDGVPGTFSSYNFSPYHG